MAPNPPTKFFDAASRRNGRWGGLLLLLLAGFAVHIAYEHYQKFDWPVVTAEVLSKKVVKRRRHTDHLLFMRYTPAGAQEPAKAAADVPEADYQATAIGQQVRIHYDPQFPHHDVLPAGGPRVRVVTVLLILAVAGLGVCALRWGD